MAPDELRTYVYLSDLLLTGGRLPEAARDALEGLAAARRLGYERSTGVVMAANAAEALLGLGDWARAEEVLDAALRAPGGFRPEALHILRAELALGRGELEAGTSAPGIGFASDARAAVDRRLRLPPGGARPLGGAPGGRRPARSTGCCAATRRMTCRSVGRGSARWPCEPRPSGRSSRLFDAT